MQKVKWVCFYGCLLTLVTLFVANYVDNQKEQLLQIGDYRFMFSKTFLPLSYLASALFGITIGIDFYLDKKKHNEKENGS